MVKKFDDPELEDRINKIEADMNVVEHDLTENIRALETRVKILEDITSTIGEAIIVIVATIRSLSDLIKCIALS